MVERFFKRCSRIVQGSLMTLAAGVTLWFISSTPVAAMQTVAVAWTPSPDTTVAGYNVYYGTQPGVYLYRVRAGVNASASIANLREGQTNFFIVKAYNTQGVESAPSNELSFTVPGVLTLTPRTDPRGPAVVNFPVVAGRTYILQATEDLKSWVTVWQTTGASAGWVQYEDREGANLRMRFYRLILQ